MSIFIWIRTIILYTFPAITLIGIIANSLSFLIFSRKRFYNTIFSTYFRFYLVVQTINISFSINRLLETNLNIFFVKISNFTCKFRYFFFYANFAIASWFLVIISLDRYLSIAYPAKFFYRKKFIFQIFVSICIISYNICVYIPFWFSYLEYAHSNRTNVTQTKCELPFKAGSTIHLLQSTLIPFTFMFLFTSFTIKIVFDSRKSTSSNSNNKSKDMKFAISSIAINIIFLLFNSPVFFLDIISRYSDLFTNLNNLFMVLQSVSLFLLYTNMGSTFFINYFFNSMFKKEMFGLLLRTK
jgi:hypothetical protein